MADIYIVVLYEAFACVLIRMNQCLRLIRMNQYLRCDLK